MQQEDEEIEWLDEDEESSLALSSEGERASAVASVLQDQEERKRGQEHGRPPERRPLVLRLAFLAVCTAGASYLWLGSPSWLERKPPPPPSLAVERLWVESALYLQAQQIEAFRARNGRLPASREEAGPGVPGVEYARVDARTYRLEGGGHRAALVYTAGEPMDSLRAALDRVLRGSGP